MAEHGKRIAVIVNEFGEVGIDNTLLLDADEEILEMNNGCICCKVRGDLIRLVREAIFKMFTKFEQFATTSLIGSQESLPRKNGHLYFERAWEKTAFALVIALANQGNYEWEDFRQQLITKISEWEAENPKNDSSWDYYQRWLLAFEEIVFQSNLVDPNELSKRTEEIIETCREENCQSV